MKLLDNIAGATVLLGWAWLELMTSDGMRTFFRTWPANPYRTKRSKEGD